ncbi:Histidine kinase-, DNA gyrase B-, and HSP90-like ATPase [Lachnospiraceae bacterium NE2001]|nr:Histidine kinase-, DNA gyrase B-, and HSP90-like ATPase [Lachnospiraceae bacterium NE2001]
MYRKLRLKFIGIATLSTAVVLFIVLGSVNLITYRNIVSDIYTRLDFISKNSDAILETEEIEKMKNKDITPETQYEARYITVMVDDAGNVIDFDMAHIAAIENSELNDFIKYATSRDDARGIFTYDGLSYAFLKTSVGNVVKLTIMDCTRNISTINYLKRFSIYIGTLGLLIVMLMVSIFARKVVEPFVKNSKAQRQFITNASHELKTPLAVISANTEVIEMISGKSEWTESTVKQVNRLSELISQLVVLSRLEERQDIVLSDVDMSAEVSSVMTSFKSIAETNDITLVTEIEDGIHVMADQKGLRELVNILMDNAVKYCDEKGTVAVSLARKGKSALFTVSNDYAAGEGVDYRQFFDRFYREDKSHNSEKQGYGIGLSMAESLVRMFKGKIAVSYKKPVITFTITL